ncbi:MAG: EAL domain-containing protein [Catonella sp.]|uniref:EAL domain-containing protein n=1 Tax=Catonella sp. TaxID=2382125 RepID=UPI003F9FB946
MVNNYWFEVAAFILELVLGYMLIFRNTVTLPYSKIFKSLYICSFFSSLTALSQVLIEYYVFYNNKDIGNFTLILNILSMVFFYAHILCCAFFALYEYSVLNIKINDTLTKFLLYSPAAVAIFTITLNPFAQTVFYISPVSGYHRRLLLYLLYVIAFYYLAFITITIRMYGQNIRNDKRIAFTILPYIPVLGTIIQFFLPQLAIESFFMTIAVLITYITIESPSDYIDFVTGLQNKDALFTNFSVAMSMRKPIAIITVNIEMIDALDKELGIDCTNALILDVSIFLSRLLKHANVYSYGRGKFAIYISLDNSWANIHMAEILADKIEERFKAPFDITDTNRMLLLKRVFIYNCPKDISNSNMLNEILQLESTATVSNKQKYLTIDDIDINVTDKERLISSKILNLYEKPSIELKFLPEYNVSSSSFDSVKAELTMNTAEIGYVNSHTFISVAEKYGLIISLYNYILEMLFKTIRDSDLIILGIRSVEIVIPISILLKKNEGEKLVNLAAQYDIPPKLICFELAKNTIADYEGVIAENMKAIHNSGFRFTLENYGNGYTNASAFLEMPITSVSIDKVLTGNALESELADNLMNCTLELLKEFGMIVKAKHIETENAKNYAIQLGCDYLQGYYFSKPLLANDLAKFLKKEVNTNGI